MTSHTSPSRPLAAAFAGLGLLTLAGCALDGGSAQAEATDTDETLAPTSSETASASAYADGTYTADGSYMAPSGSETITVSLTIADDVVTDVSVVGDAADHQAAEFQGRFASGIAAEVVGRDIADLSVSRVSGSSLTSAGFNTAVETIRSEALA